jgi:methyltransferase (TIGR00027 family)
MRIALTRCGAALDPVLRRILAAPDEPYSAWFVEEHSEEARLQLERWKSGAPHPLIDLLRQSIGKGSYLFILLRKRFVEDQLRAALQAGADQVVVFGAGYDPLPLRLAPEFPGVTFFELDYPATQEVKQRALEKHGATTPQIVLVGVDFSRESAEDRLRAQPRFRPKATSVFLAEGVLMYLEPADVDQLFAIVGRNSGPGSRFIFTLVETRAVNAAERQQTIRGMALTGEPVRSSLDREQVEGFLRARGFERRTMVDRDGLRGLYLEPLGIDREVSEGTLIVVAEVVP